MAVAEELQIIIDAKVTQAVKDLKKVQKGIGDNEKQTSGLIKAFKSLAGPVALGAVILGMVRLGKASLKAFAIQEQAEARLEQTIKSTGEAAGLTADELKDMATGLQGVTKFGDEAIIGAEALLLTFKDIGGDVFPRALESILDVSEAMGTGLKESSVQVGKALNDPVQGITALTRVGIQFTDEQKNMIKSLVETGDKAAAQGIILEELESQFGGVAKAAADTATGAFVQMNNSLGDLGEVIGRNVVNEMKPFAEVTKTITDRFVAWLAVAEEIKEAMDRVSEGTGNTPDKLVAYNQELIVAQEQLKIWTDNQYADLKVKEDMIAIIESKINAIKQSIIQEGKLAASEALTTKVLKEQAEAEKKREEQFGTSDKAFAALEDRAEARRQSTLSDDEKLLESLELQFQAEVKLRDALKASGKEWSGQQALLNDTNEQMIKLRESMEEQIGTVDELGESIIVAWQGPLEEVSFLYQKIFDLMGLVIGRTEQQNTAIVAAGEDWLSVEQEKVEHLIWIDALETEINERRIKEAAEELKAFETLIKQKITLVKQYSNMALSFLSAIDTLQANNANAELMRLQEEGASQEELDAKKREIAHDEALRRKNFALMNIGLNTAIAIVAALTSIPPNVPLSLAVGAVGAAQLAAAASIPIPALATGGDFVTTGPTPIMVGDNASGQERVTVEPLGGTGGNGNEKIWLSIDGQGFWAVMQREGIDNRKIHSSNGGRI